MTYYLHIIVDNLHEFVPPAEPNKPWIILARQITQLYPSLLSSDSFGHNSYKAVTALSCRVVNNEEEFMTTPLAAS